MASKRMTMREKVLKMTVQGIVKHAIHGVQINIFDLGKPEEAGMAAAKEADSQKKSDAEIEAAITKAVEESVKQIRKN